MNKGDTYIVAEELLGSVARETGLQFVEQSARPFAGSTLREGQVSSIRS